MLPMQPRDVPSVQALDDGCAYTFPPEGKRSLPATPAARPATGRTIPILCRTQQHPHQHRPSPHTIPRQRTRTTAHPSASPPPAATPECPPALCLSDRYHP
ncbi:hypothetical protein GCM10027168_43850 [Streptomyces capparidis]